MQHLHSSYLLRTCYIIGVLHLSLLISNTFCHSAGSYRISAAKTYIAFSGKLELNYTIPSNECLTNAFIELSCVERKHYSVIQNLFLGCSSGSHTIACGLVNSAGRYVFRIYSQKGGDILDELFFNVLWPKTTVSLPVRHNAFEGNISAIVNSAASCKSLIPTYTMYLDLIFFGEEPKSTFINEFNPKRIHSITIVDISLNTTYNFPCNKTELPGKYFAELRSVKKEGEVPDQIITESGIMNVTWSKHYEIIKIARESFTCRESVSIRFEHPKCSRSTDRIRMYAMHRKVSGSLASPLEAKYRAERFAFRNISTVYFNCSLFDIAGDVVGYCFVYETMTSEGAVREQKKRCVSARDNADGNWDVWSSWAMCTTTCGTGKQNRFRMCNKPPPTRGGRFCKGEPVQWRDCHVHCDKPPHETPLEPVENNNTCVCGCIMTNSTGSIVATGGCSGLNIWTIEVAQHHKITLLFQYANLRPSTQWLKIRDGCSPNAKLIAFSAVGGIPDFVTSSSNNMRIEFMTPSIFDSPSHLVSHKKPTDNSKIPYLYGFIANYTISAINETAIALSPHSLMAKEPEWENTVAAIGIIVCVMMLGISIGCGIYQRVYRRQWHKYTVASQGDSPYHAKSSAPGSPTSAAGDAEIEHDMEAPLTKSGGGKRKKQGACTPIVTSPRTSMSSASNFFANSRRVETKAEVQTHGTVSSPYSANATPVDGLTVIISSPSSKARSQKSQKVHPSEQRKGKSNSKKQKKESTTLDLSERVVPGSSGTPSSSQTNGNAPSVKSPASITDTSSTKSEKDKSQKKDKSKHFRLPTPKGSNRNSDGIPLMTLQEKSDYDLKALSQSNGNEDYVGAGKNITTAFITNEKKPKRPTSLVDDDVTLHLNKASPSLVANKPPLDTKAKLFDGRRNPKPDGQSPEPLRGDKSPKSMTPLSVRSIKTLSPTRSLLTPSDATSEGCELEYDDFIMDDPLSYFDTEDTLKLRWQGTERIGNTTLKPSESTLTFD